MSDLQQRFDALGPWFTRFEIDGASYGGANSYEHDHRAGLFFDWLGRPNTILELASFEGANSLQLAAPPFVKRFIGLEGRPENIKRARLAVELLGRGNIEFIHADLDEESLALEQFGRFDAVWCGGVLYHLTRPWRLIEKIAKVTDRLFLDTQYSETGEVTVAGYAGSIYREGGYSDPLSGLTATSFWMTLPSLADALSYAGFAICNQHVVPDWDGRGPRIHVAATKSRVQ